MLQLQIDQKNLIDIDATAAGPAKLRAEVRDSNGELLAGDRQPQIHSLGYGKFQLQFTPKRTGKYKIYIYCSELVVPSAYPLLGIVESGKGAPAEIVAARNGYGKSEEERKIGEESQRQIEHLDIGKVILRGDGLHSAKIREAAEFIVDASELRKGSIGKCSAMLLGEKADVPVKISALRNQVYKGIYTPLVGGTYQLSVQIDGQHVPGSPSSVHVESHSHPAEAIEVDNRPLKMGIIGEDLRTVIDARLRANSNGILRIPLKLPIRRED